MAADSPQYAGAVGATELLGAVRGLVRDFFGCLHCREHFLAAYEACAFDRCSIAQGDYDKLQVAERHLIYLLLHQLTLRTVSLIVTADVALPPA